MRTAKEEKIQKNIQVQVNPDISPLFVLKLSVARAVANQNIWGVATHDYSDSTIPATSQESSLPRGVQVTISDEENGFRPFLGKKFGLNRDLNPGPPAPKAGIIPLDH